MMVVLVLFGGALARGLLTVRIPDHIYFVFWHALSGHGPRWLASARPAAVVPLTSDRAAKTQ
jgi:hypothetical protein